MDMRLKKAKRIIESNVVISNPIQKETKMPSIRITAAEGLAIIDPQGKSHAFIEIDVANGPGLDLNLTSVELGRLGLSEKKADRTLDRVYGLIYRAIIWERIKRNSK